MTSQAQILANQKNAQLSTGAKSEAGKAKISHNAVKTALTGQTVLLQTDDIAGYEKLGQMLIGLYKPATQEEELIVQSVIDAEWRLQRIPSLEEGIYAVGRNQLIETNTNIHLLDVEVYLKYERQLKNLSLQENRIRRNREKDIARLKEIQRARFELEFMKKRAAEIKAKQQEQAQQAQAGPHPQIGFEITTSPNPSETPLKSAA
jgi:hypothetical protein